MTLDEQRQIIGKAFGEITALFMSQKIIGTKMIMPTEELMRIEKHTINLLNANLWKEIMDISRPAPPEVSIDCDVVRLIELREILEKYNILKSEKDGM